MKSINLKLLKVLGAVALASLPMERSRAAVDTQYDTNDLLLFFLNPTGTTGTDVSFQFSLGSVQNVFRAAATPSDPTYGTTIFLGNIGANLTSTYGSDWTSLSTNSTIFMGAAGQAGATHALATSFTNGDFARTIYITRRRDTPGTVGQPNSLVGYYPINNTGTAGFISGTNNAMLGLQGVAKDYSQTLVDDYNPFSPTPTTPGTAYTSIQQGIIGRLLPGPHPGSYDLGSVTNIVRGLDLWRVTPSASNNSNHWHVANNIPANAVTANVTSHFLGTVALSGNGDIHFIAVPEPSTFALLGLAGLAAAATAARRRRANQTKHNTKMEKTTLLPSLLVGAVALGVATSAKAQTEITITGATAFRQATVTAIYNAFTSGNRSLGVTFNVAHDFSGNNLSSLRASNKAIFKGDFPGLPGTTVIRTSFNGSTEGLNAIAGNNNPSFLTESALLNTGSIQGGTTAPTNTLRPKFSFSDVYQSTSPVANEVLNPVGSSAVGVVTFAMCANKGAPNNWTNTTIQQCRALWQTGIQKLSLFTGDDNDDNILVFATGRNDGSGTRSAYLTEWTYGVANLVNQYIATTAGLSTNGTITAITLVPQGGTGTGNLTCPDGSGNASNLWGNDVVGNGGYRSNSGLRGLLQRTSTSVNVYDGENQTPLIEDANILLLSWVSTADARDIKQGGGKILAFNGVYVEPLFPSDPNNYNSTGFSETDFNKIAQGAYSAWSYQHLYHHGTLTTNEQAWRDAMVNTWLKPALESTANGIALDNMECTRPDDGYPIVATLSID